MEEGGRWVRERFEDATLLALKMAGRGSRAKECRQSLETEKGKETDSSSEPPEGT